jgi:hypothetical protein
MTLNCRKHSSNRFNFVTKHLKLLQVSLRTTESRMITWVFSRIQIPLGNTQTRPSSIPRNRSWKTTLRNSLRTFFRKMSSTSLTKSIKIVKTHCNSKCHISKTFSWARVKTSFNWSMETLLLNSRMRAEIPKYTKLSPNNYLKI